MPASHQGGPATTVVIPVWGAHAAFVADAARSVVEQDVDVRVLLVDNASVERVPDVDGAEVVRLAERVPIGRARNAGLEQARTPYVMFWDADDLMLPGALRRLQEVLDREPGTVAVTMRSRVWAPETGPRQLWHWPRPIMYRLSHRPALFALVSLLYNPFTTTGPALLRTRQTAESGGFHEGMAYFEDWSLSIALAVRGRVRMLTDVGRHYRLHGDSLSLGHLDSPDQGAWFRGLRERAREDPATPRWLRACLPLVRLHHELRTRRRVRSSKGQGLYASVLDQNQGGPPPGAG